MSVKYFTGIDLNKNQLLNAQVHVCASGEYPQSPVDGQIIYDSTNKQLKVYKDGNPGSWSSVGEQLTAGEYIRIENGSVNLKLYGSPADGDILTVDGSGNVVASTMDINGHTLTGPSIMIEAGDIPFTNDESGDSSSDSVYDVVDDLAATVEDHIGGTNPHGVTASQLGDGTLSANVKATTPAQSSNDTSIATTEYVTQKFGSVDALQYKGALAGGSTGSYGALTPAARRGDVYKVSAAGLIDGVKVESGDMLICNYDGSNDEGTPAADSENYDEVAACWDFIQGNVDGVVVYAGFAAPAMSNTLPIFGDSTGKLIGGSGINSSSIVKHEIPVTGSYSGTGSSTHGVYVDSSGVVQQMAHSVEADVPQGAVFTDHVPQLATATIAADAASPYSATVSFVGTYLSSYAKDSSGKIVMVETALGTNSADETTVEFKCAQAPGTVLTCVAVYI